MSMVRLGVATTQRSLFKDQNTTARTHRCQWIKKIMYADRTVETNGNQAQDICAIIELWEAKHIKINSDHKGDVETERDINFLIK